MSRLGELETFVAVVEEGGFSAAATRMGVSKSHISKTLSRLEERLGVRLLHRTTRKLSLTEVGQAFLERGQAILAEAGEAERAVTATQTTPRGTLRLSAPLSFSLRHLMPVVSRYLSDHPEVRVELALDDRRVDLLDEGFDLAVRIAHGLDDSSFIARKIANVQPYLLASPDWIARHKAPRHPQALAHLPCLRYAYLRTGPVWVFTDPQGVEAAVRVQGPLEVNNGDSMLQAAQAGLGLCVLPDFVCCDAVRSGSLVRVLPEWTLSPAQVFAVYPHSRHLSAKVRVFIDRLAAAFEGSPWALDPPPPAP